jgi:CheY-like chemotaxis protein
MEPSWYFKKGNEMNVVSQKLKYFAADLNILVVDDNERLRMELERMLKIFFKSVSVASDSLVACELYQKSSYDLVITELDMPNNNGVELPRKIKKFNTKQAIIILSGYIDIYMLELNDIGINSLVSKPFKLNEFLEILCKESEILFLEKQTRKNDIEQ